MTVVFKLGGSLLKLDRLSERLCAVLELRAGQRRLVCTGGGAIADVVRDWSRIHRLRDETAHWLAVSSLDLNRQLLQELLGWKSANSRSAAYAIWDAGCPPVALEMTKFLTDEEATTTDRVPHDWNVTSDSLAAWTVAHWPADELVMVKSVPVPLGLSAEEASRNELVDAYFPHIAGKLRRITWCNLQATTPSIEPWLANPLQ